MNKKELFFSTMCTLSIVNCSILSSNKIPKWKDDDFYNIAKNRKLASLSSVSFYTATPCIPTVAIKRLVPDSTKGNVKYHLYYSYLNSSKVEIDSITIPKNGRYILFSGGDWQCFFDKDMWKQFPFGLSPKCGDFLEIDASVTSTGYLKKGHKVGWWIDYHSCSDSMPGTYKTYLYQETKSAIDKEYHRRALAEHYVNGLKHGQYIVYDLQTQKQIYQTRFQHGTGYYKGFYPLCGMPIRSEGQYLKGRKIGRWIYYTPLGEQKIVQYPNVPAAGR
jgi:hypothetical protein